MLFISKMIHDPTYVLKNNRIGLTVGLTVHTPKYWNCRKFDFDMGGFWVSPPLPEWLKESRHNTAQAHANCKWPYRHKSYNGYIYWTGPTRRYTVQLRRPFFAVGKHGRYVRWMDNGPKPVELGLDARDSEVLARFMKHHRWEVAEVRREMDEWRRTHERSGHVRDAEHHGD